jgi:hypothetical protein
LRQETAPLISAMHKSAVANRNHRPKLLFSDGECPVATLEDLEYCLLMFRYSEQQRDRIANVIRSLARPELIKIIDSDGMTELSIDALIEKYCSKELADV